MDDANTATPVLTEITSSPPVLFPTGYVNCIAVDPNDEDHIVLVFSNYGVYSLFTSYDRGESWEKCAGNLEESSSGSGSGPSVRWVSILPVADGDLYFAGTSVGLFATDTLNGTETIWSPVAENTIGNAVVEMIETRPLDGLVVVATHGKGVFSTNITSVDVVAGVKEIKMTSMAEVYPNPVEDVLTVKMNQATKELSIYTFNGALVKTVKSINKTTQIDVSELTSGVYFIRDETSNLVGKFVKM